MRFHNIEPNNIENGTGIRTLLWVSGCYHNCKGCHNPITHDPDDGIEFDDDAKKEFFDDLSKPYVSGATISGGDPLCYYPADTLDLVTEIKDHFKYSKTVWIYTGFTLDWILNTILTSDSMEVRDVYKGIILSTDVLCDGKFEEDKKSKEYHWVGSTNQRVIDLKKTFEAGKLKFLEPEQEKFCTVDSTSTNELIRQFLLK